MIHSGRKISVAWYVVIDYITASISWLCFYAVRSALLHDKGAYPISYQSWLYILIVVPVGWLVLYSTAGTYTSLYKKSRLAEFTLTFVCSLFGCCIFFFVFVLNDPANVYSYRYIAFASLFGIHFIATFFSRFALLNIVKRQLLSGTVFFNTLMIGSRDNAIKVYTTTEKNLLDGGYRYSGFIAPEPNGITGIQKLIPKLGTIDELEADN